MNPSSLSGLQIDALREASSIGAGHAATSLSKLLGGVVRMRVPEVRTLPLGLVPEALGGAEHPIAAVHIRLRGEGRGNLLVVFPVEGVVPLLERLGVPESAPMDPSPLALSALAEVGNIVCASYLSAIARMLGMRLLPSVPSVAIDMAGAVVDRLLSEISEVSDHALVLESRLAPGTPLDGRIYFFPDPGTIAALLVRLGRV